MRSGSEADRVEDTMGRILTHALPSEEKDQVRVFVLLNAVFVGVGSLHTSFLQIKSRSFNLAHITEVNQISRDFVEDKITLEETYRRLQELQRQKSKPISSKMVLAAGLLGGSTALLFGGVPADMPAAAVAAVIGYLVYHFISAWIDIPFVCEFFAAFIGGTAGLLVMQLIGVNPNQVMMGAVIPLVPGIAITNSIRDIMRRHYITGLIRFVESMFIGASLGGGIALVFIVFSSLV